MFRCEEYVRPVLNVRGGDRKYMITRPSEQRNKGVKGIIDLSSNSSWQIQRTPKGGLRLALDFALSSRIGFA